MSLCREVHPTGAKCGLEEGHYPATNHRPRSDHHCHARGCTVATKSEMLMCLRHWRMVPKQLQREVWKHYRAGQCDDRKVSSEWLTAADAAIDAVPARASTLGPPPTVKEGK